MTQPFEICAALNSGNPYQPYIKFLEGIDSFDSIYPNSGMYAQVIDCFVFDYEDDGTPVYQVKLDYSHFDTFNQSRETPDYYDREGNPTLTAREAGIYRTIDTIFLPDQEGFFEVVLPYKDNLPFEDIDLNRVIEIAHELGYHKVRDADDLKCIAQYLFILGDVSSEMASLLRLWLRKKQRKTFSEFISEYKGL